jgi:hypothetical protein
MSKLFQLISKLHLDLKHVHQPNFIATCIHQRTRKNVTSSKSRSADIKVQFNICICSRDPNFIAVGHLSKSRSADIKIKFYISN